MVDVKINRKGVSRDLPVCTTLKSFPFLLLLLCVCFVYPVIVIEEWILLVIETLRSGFSTAN